MDKLIVMSLEDENSKQLAKVLSNDTALKMLNKLAETRCSASELSKQLGIPISTIQYNLELLTKSNMIKETAYRYSEKGKKVLYYEPMKKLIVIAPENEKLSVFNILKDKFLAPISLGIAALVGYGLQPFFMSQQKFATAAGAPAFEVVNVQTPFQFEPWVVFIIGGLITLVILLSLTYIKNRIRR